MTGCKPVSLNVFGPCSGLRETHGTTCCQGSRSQGFASAPDSLIRSFLVKATDIGDEGMAWPPEQGPHPSQAKPTEPALYRGHVVSVAGAGGTAQPLSQTGPSAQKVREEVSGCEHACALSRNREGTSEGRQVGWEHVTGTQGALPTGHPRASPPGEVQLVSRRCGTTGPDSRIPRGKASTASSCPPLGPSGPRWPPRRARAWGSADLAPLQEGHPTPEPS